MTKIYDVAVVTGSYEGRDGKNKNSYSIIGKMIEKDDGRKSIKLDTLPIGNEWDGWMMIFDKKKQPAQTKNTDGDFPF